MTHEQARRFYDRFGARQDRQGWYEDAALDRLFEHVDFTQVREVVELGCGTGKVARRLFGGFLGDRAHYRGFDSSRTMVELARQRLECWSDRASVTLTDGSLELPVLSASADLFLSSYVLDLLSHEDIDEALGEAIRILSPGGQIGIASLTEGTTLISRSVSRLWQAVHRLRPAWVGGCRPIRLAARLAGDPRWQVRHSSVVAPYGLASEVVVACKRAESAEGRKA